MKDQSSDIANLHWMMDIIQSIDIGLVVVDRQYAVQVWNNFMENHSGLKPDHVRDRSLFEIFPDIPRVWYQHKIDSVFLLKNRAFTSWETRPYIFKFKNYRPITGTAEFMYQYTTLIPLLSVAGQVNHVCIIVYDVTDTVVNAKALEKANAKLVELSVTDRLTKLFNRGHWEECLQREYTRCRRYQSVCSLMMFDIDHFKKVNDTYGHMAGDYVIQKTADVLRSIARGTDVIGRYGGEEYGVILVDTNAEQAKLMGERLRKAIEEVTVSYEGHDIKYTISAGVSEYKEELSDHKQWIEEADQGLYQSKRSGRNCVSIFDPSNADSESSG